MDGKTCRSYSSLLMDFKTSEILQRYVTKMPLQCKSLKQHVAQAWSLTVMLYTSGPRKGWRHNLWHFIVCFTISIIFTAFLFIGLRMSLHFHTVLSGGIAGVCMLMVTAALFFSKHVRCFSTLFLISCGMKQGRNLLITAGTGLVVFWHVQNTFSNLTELSRSLICNLEKKRISLHVTPLKNYVDMLGWLGKQLKKVSDFKVVKFTSTFNVSSNVDSQALKEKLQHAEATLNATAQNISNVIRTVSSVSQMAIPALGFILVLVLTALYLRKYTHNKKFENKFITRRFTRYDERQKAEGKPFALPLTENEAKSYILIPSTRLTVKEGKTMLKFCIPVLTNLLAWIVLISIDALIYWLIVIITSHLEKMEPFHVPLTINYEEDQTIIGIPFQYDSKHRDFSYSVELFEKECLFEPKLLIHQSVVPLCVITIILITLVLLSAKLAQLRLLVTDLFYMDNAEERVRHLHTKILRKRTKLKAPQSANTALFKKKKSPVSVKTTAAF